MIGDQRTYLEAPFYNSKSSKLNGSASPFGRSSYLSTKPWPELVLAAVPAITLLQEVKMSLPEVHQEPPPKEAILPLLLRLSLGPRLRLNPQFQVPPKSCVNSS